MKVQPIKPEEARNLKNVTIPDEVIMAFNESIVQNLSEGWTVRIPQSEVVEKILDKLDGERESNRKLIFKNRWLDIESIYQAVGWKVTYDGPGYNESYPASFCFAIQFKTA